MMEIEQMEPGALKSLPGAHGKPKGSMQNLGGQFNTVQTEVTQSQQYGLLSSDKPKEKAKMQSKYGGQSVLDDLDDDFDI